MALGHVQAARFGKNWWKGQRMLECRLLAVDKLWEMERGGEWGFVGPHLNSGHGCTDGAGYREDKVGDGTGVGVHEAEPP
jgi:hypothetical protein